MMIYTIDASSMAFNDYNVGCVDLIAEHAAVAGMLYRPLCSIGLDRAIKNMDLRNAG